jgi:hypothetical protein
MTLVAFPNLIFHAATMPRITCLTCGDVMFMSLIEPISKGYEVRSFHCVDCDVTEEFVTATEP